MLHEDRSRLFWRDALAIHGTLTKRVVVRVLVFFLVALFVSELNAWLVQAKAGFDLDLGIEVGPFEVAGAALGVILVLRTNAGYDRWWEARKLWGTITNESRNLVVNCLAYGPVDSAWRETLVRWAAAFPHVIRHCLRNERAMPRVEALLGIKEAQRVADAEHMPSYVALRIAQMIRDGCENPGPARLGLLYSENSRFILVDAYGACERILKAPLPIAYVILLRRFLVIFLIFLPFTLLPSVARLTPLLAVLISYPLVALDDIGSELQNPFDVRNVGHLPLDRICSTIERDVLALGGLKAPKLDEAEWSVEAPA
jgi:putative membrane protein